MSLINIVEKCLNRNDYTPLIESVPYAKLLGISCVRAGDEVIFTLPAKEDNIGNPTLPAIHGGVLGGFIEHAAVLQVILKMEEPKFPKVIDLSIDYLSAGLFKDTFAEVKILRIGRRMANVSVTVWQTLKSKPIATARAHLLLN